MDRPQMNNQATRIDHQADRKNETIDDSATILSDTILQDETALDGRDDEVAPSRASGGPHSQQPPTRSQGSRTNHREGHRDGPKAGQRRGRLEHPVRTVGPNEKIYRSKHEPFVKSTIRDFDRRNPGKLRDYRSLPPEEQAKEQQRVLDLLSRLGIGKGSQQHKQPPEHLDSQRHAPNRRTNGQSPASMSIDRERLLNDTMSPIMSPGCHGPPQMEDHDEQDSFSVAMPVNDEDPLERSHQSLDDYDQSRILLSPVPLQNPDDQPQSPSTSDHAKEVEILNHSSESVELVRAGTQRSPYSSPGYGSPDALKTTNPYKRQASTSAKRGADMYRTKYNEDVVPPRPDDDESVSDHSIVGDDGGLSTRLERLSISPVVDAGPKSFFAASQSPISPKLTYGSSSDSDEADSIDGGRGKNRSTPSTTRKRGEMNSRFCDETIHTSTTYDDKAARRAMREIPVNVGMKTGSTFHLEKLNVKRSELTRHANSKQNGAGGIIGGGTRRRLVNFPDPLTKYNSKQKKVLNEVFELLCRSELDSRDLPLVETTSANVLLSLSYEQVMDLCLKLFLNDDEENARYDRRGFQTSLSAMKGRTVIVARTKDDAAMWERALREGTGCSVFNHATAPLSERVRLSTAEKATKYDVVLTTYDALKSTDIAIPVDDRGYAIISKPKTEKNGWMTSRTVSGSSSSQSESICPQKCKQLCVLHKVNFQRIVFVDILGRKSFLAKNGTARAAASMALRANSR